MATGRGFKSVTLSNTVDIDKDDRGQSPEAFYFGTGGTAAIVGLDGSVGVFTNIADGQTLPVGGKRINTTGSSGIANVVAIYV